MLEKNSIRDPRVRKMVEYVIDAFGWKYSWHLPKDRFGYTDWDNVKTLEECLKVAKDYSEETRKFHLVCEQVIELLTKAIKDKETPDGTHS